MSTGVFSSREDSGCSWSGIRQSIHTPVVSPWVKSRKGGISFRPEAQELFQHSFLPLNNLILLQAREARSICCCSAVRVLLAAVELL